MPDNKPLTVEPCCPMCGCELSTDADRDNLVATYLAELSADNPITAETVISGEPYTRTYVAIQSRDAAVADLRTELSKAEGEVGKLRGMLSDKEEMYQTALADLEDACTVRDSEHERAEQSVALKIAAESLSASLAAQLQDVTDALQHLYNACGWYFKNGAVMALGAVEQSLAEAQAALSTPPPNSLRRYEAKVLRDVAESKHGLVSRQTHRDLMAIAAALEATEETTT